LTVSSLYHIIICSCVTFVLAVNYSITYRASDVNFALVQQTISASVKSSFCAQVFKII